MADVVVIGAGLGGLSTAMLLALDGHDVTVVERDAQEPPDDPTAAWAGWERRGVGQFRMLHLLLPLWRHLAEQELPRVVSALEERGGLRYNLVTEVRTGDPGPRGPDDDRFEILTARRPVIEAAVAATASGTYGLSIRRGVAVAGLLTGRPVVPGVPHVIGVRTETGEEIRADLVVDTSGRRSALPGWLEAIGAKRPVEELEDSGFRYYSRHFRSEDGRMPAATAPLLQSYDSVTILTLPADNGTWGVGFIASAEDRELHRLSDPARWHAALARYPHAAHWGEGEPITGVDAFSKIEDRYRRFMVDGVPVATGIVAVADAWACTNPSLGRGASIALLHARGLRDLLREVGPAEADKLAARWDEVTETTVTPIYRATLAYDRHRLAELRAQRAGVPYETDDATWTITKAFANASLVDPGIRRGFASVMSLLATPAEAVSVPGVLDRILELAANGSAPPLPGPTRPELLETVNA